MIEIIPNWHPIFVHFTVGLLSVSAGLFILSRLFLGNKITQEFLTVAYWNLWLGTLFALLTVIAGFLAFYSVAHDAMSHVAMETHRNWAIVTFLVFMIVAIWSMFHYHNKQKPNRLFLAGLVLGVTVLLSTAWHGAELVYRYGLGVISLPAPENEPAGEHEHR